MCLLGCATAPGAGGGTSTDVGGIWARAGQVKTNATNTLRIKLYVLLEENA
jgi:hypothetical protein